MDKTIKYKGWIIECSVWGQMGSDVRYGFEAEGASYRLTEFCNCKRASTAEKRAKAAIDKLTKD